MARLARVVLPGLPHHITHRGNRRSVIFRDREDRETYLRLLGVHSRKYSLDILSDALMTNHPFRCDSARKEFSGENDPQRAWGVC